MTAEYESIRQHQHAIAQVVPLLEAMRSVAEIAFRRAERRLPPLARYAQRIDAQLAQLQGAVAPRFPAGESTGRCVMVVISSERGLCGGFNRRLIESVLAELRRERAAGRAIELACLGRQGRRFLEAAHEPIAYFSPMSSFAPPSYLEVERLAIDLLDLMEAKRCGCLAVMHSAPLRRFQYHVTSRRLLPLEAEAAAPGGAPDVKPPEDAENLFTQLVTERVLIDLYQAVIESVISEELARITAMRLATENARHLEEELSFEANRARQNSETNALLEIITGFRAASGGPG